MDYLGAALQIYKSRFCLEYGGKVYKIFDTATTYTNASRLCQSFGGQLARITNAEINERLRKAIDRIPLPAGAKKISFFFGLTDLASEGQWAYIDGQIATYTNWELREPNGRRSENCAVLESDGTWSDRPCNNQLLSLAPIYYICEKSKNVLTVTMGPIHMKP